MFVFNKRYKYGILWFIPILIYFWIGVCEYSNLKRGKTYDLFSKYID